MFGLQIAHEGGSAKQGSSLTSTSREAAPGALPWHEIEILSPYVDGLALHLPDICNNRLAPLELSERGKSRFATRLCV